MSVMNRSTGHEQGPGMRPTPANDENPLVSAVKSYIIIGSALALAAVAWTQPFMPEQVKARYNQLRSICPDGANVYLLPTVEQQSIIIHGGTIDFKVFTTRVACRDGTIREAIGMERNEVYVPQE